MFTFRTPEVERGRAAYSHLAPLAGRGRFASGALAKRSKSGEGACPQTQTRRGAPSPGFLRSASLRSESDLSPRGRGEVEQVAPLCGSDRVEPAEMHRITFAGEQGCRLVKRQAHNVGVGADDLHHERSGQALDGIAAGLVAPFARGQVGLEILLRQALEAHPRLDQALAERLLRRDDADAGIDPMVAAGEEPQALRRL